MQMIHGKQVMTSNLVGVVECAEGRDHSKCPRSRKGLDAMVQSRRRDAMVGRVD